MRPPENEAPRLVGGGGARVYRNANGEVRLARTEASAQAAGKALAVWLYCTDVQSLPATRAAFARHPKWVSA
jgi:hypothetical protein